MENKKVCIVSLCRSPSLTNKDFVNFLFNFEQAPSNVIPLHECLIWYYKNASKFNITDQPSNQKFKLGRISHLKIKMSMIKFIYLIKQSAVYFVILSPIKLSNAITKIHLSLIIKSDKS